MEQPALREPPLWERLNQIAKFVISLAWLCFQTLLLLFPQPPLIQCPLHLGFALALMLLWYPLKADCLNNAWRRGVDLFLLFSVVAALLYYLLSAGRLTNRMEGIDEILRVDVTIGLLLTGVVLECVRRVTGWSLLAVILAFLAFGFLGAWFPGWMKIRWIPEMLKFSGFTFKEAIENFTMTANGLLGVTTSTSVMFVFYFVAFGAIYSAIGGGQLFIDVGLRLAGKQKGAAAKATVIASALMGTVSGSAVANVSAVGVFTIPLMRKSGYSAIDAAAIEAINSTGGQLMPPVMGVAAFIMAEILQMSYAKIALAGVIPAVAFYLSLFFLLDLNARKNQRELANDARQASESFTPRLHLLIPPLLMISLLALGRSAGSAAALATAACLPTSFLATSSRRPGREWVKAIMQAARQAGEVAVPIAAIGLIIEVAVQSNLALKFATYLVELGAGNVILSMTLIVLGCIVMGMGLPTVAAYLIGAILFVPVLIDLGIPQLSAHFFVMYYCVLSMVTPPVALASFAAAGLAQADTMATSWKAFRLSLVAFFIPFVFVFEPALLAQGTLVNAAFGVLLLATGTFGWAVALEGYLTRRLTMSQRGLVGTAALSVFLAPMIAERMHTTYGIDLATSRAWTWSSAIGLTALALLWCLTGRPNK